MNKEKISIWGEWTNEIVICNYRDKVMMNCSLWAKWKHQHNNYYCENHHELINKINRERQQEFRAMVINNLRTAIYLGSIGPCCAKQINEIIEYIKEE